MNTARMNHMLVILKAPLKMDQEFNMGLWFRPDPLSCGYSACAIGCAALDRKFNKEGFGLQRPTRVNWSQQPSYRSSDYPVQLLGFDAVTEFFDLSYDDAQHLFDPHRYRNTDSYLITREMVIDRIENFMAEESGACLPLKLRN